MVDVMLDLERLRTTQAGLDASIAELSNASKINDGLEHSIGRPDDRSGLRDKASDFESDWDDKRDKLDENLKNIQEQLKSILDGWADWEAKASKTSDQPTSTTNVSVVK